LETLLPPDLFSIITLKSGVKSLRSLERNETFHPTTGPFSEANILHIEQQRLVDRCAASEKFVIWDVGFGAAANVLAAITALETSGRTGETEIEIHSFDKTTAPIQFATANAGELQYLDGFENHLARLVSEKHVRISPRLNWYLHLGEFGDQIREGSAETSPVPPPHAIFYDPYSPATNPEMWTLDHFKRLWARLDPNRECLFTNYTRSTAVRVALLLAGFSVGTGCIIGEKAETTVASNRLGMLENPLDREWLERVRISTNAAPLRMAVYSKSGISAEDFKLLEKCPQFSTC
jgi:tRNA U34 5-methylaminomethyl-2-thiouridine-forming methyltransferase MnmC